jgi:hypothetical protein
MIMQNGTTDLTLHLAYWMGREKTNLAVLMQNGPGGPSNYKAYWVDNETDGEFLPLKIKMLDAL